MKWFVLGVVLSLMFGAVALWAAAPLEPDENPDCVVKFLPLAEDDTRVLYVKAYICPKREA